MKRPSHLLLLVFAAFGLALAARSASGSGPQQWRPNDSEKVVLHWNSEQQPKGQRVELAGRVVDQLGLPIALASVRDLSGENQVETAATGSFRLTVAWGGPIDLEITDSKGRRLHERVLPQEGDLVLVLRQALPWDSEPELPLPQPASSHLHGGEGMVRGGEGQVVVTVCETGEAVCAEDTGYYRIAVPPGDFHLIARDASGQVALCDLVPAPRREQRWMPLPVLELEKGQRLSGFLKNAAGDPVVGAALVLRGHGELRRMTTGKGGAFGFVGLAPGDFEFEVLPHGGELGLRQAFELLPGASPDLELSLRSERQLQLLVLDPKGSPLPGLYVVAREEGSSLSPSHGQTDATGRVCLRGLGGGDLSFEVRSTSNWQPMTVVGYDPESSELIVDVS